MVIMIANCKYKVLLHEKIPVMAQLVYAYVHEKRSHLADSRFQNTAILTKIPQKFNFWDF